MPPTVTATPSAAPAPEPVKPVAADPAGLTAGPRGPMQFMPGTWAQYGEGDTLLPVGYDGTG